MQVAGHQGTAVLGLIVIGVAGATLAIEPTVGGELVSAESSFGVAVLIVAVVVAVVAAVVPSVRRTSNRFEHL